ncbi:MAG: asparagine synthase (glutamine-hydrolyzing), partial [Rhodothermales bacterium]|nr:asparagine synthase (glutamine-hydrolyzing) [Rhodothermales bacterium]
RTSTDTEVIVHLYEELGERCVERLNGMFAFAIWDSRREKLVLARDRMGQKPLFYRQNGDDFAFASEMKALMSVADGDFEMDTESLHHYLSLRFVPPPRTMLSGIQKLPPAHLLVFQENRVTVKQYWELSFVGKTNVSDGDWVDMLRDKLERSVESHLVSDVPVGAFLSGGLDSSMVVAMMANHYDNRIATFAVGVEEADFDELPYARSVADRYNTRHTEQCVHSDLIGLLPRIIWHLDEPSDPIAACQYHAAEVAARHVKVVLGGDGGDELFGGFDRYYGLDYVRHYARIPALIRGRLLRPLLRRLPDSFTYKSVTQKLRWIDQLAAVPDLGERYAEATCYFRFSHLDKASLFTDSAWLRVKDLNSSEVISSPFHSAPATDMLDRMLYTDIVTRLPEHSLMLTDRMSMAHSLELRSPMLDHELVELMATYPADLKIRNRQTKFILRELAKDYLPEDIVNRDKQGFMFPIAYWFAGKLHGFLRTFLLESRFVREGIFRRDAVADLLDDHLIGRRDNHVRLWMLLNLEIWDRIYLRGVQPEAIEDEIVAAIARNEE